jgi:hypothetical protein
MLGLLAALVSGPCGFSMAASPELLADVSEQVSPDRSSDPTVVRGRAVSVDFDLLSALQPGEQLVFNLFDNATFDALVETSSAAGTWSGSIANEPPGTFILTIKPHSLAAIIRVPGQGTYRIRSLGGGAHVVQEIDDAGFPSCATAPEHGVANGGVAGDAVAGGSIVIDVLVVYTPLARAGAGGTAAIEAEMDFAVVNANNAYNNSLITTQLNLVHIAEVDYNEAGSYADHLYRLTDQADGILDEVHDLREQYGADMVALIVADTQYCGIAWLMHDLSPGFASSAFSVTTWFCAAGNLTFAHELGHNMGCAHDRDNGGSGGLFSYSYGYQEPSNLFRTVMAYNCPGGCPRYQFFSNPDVSYQGQPTGVPISEPDSAHNALTINLSAPTIAAFRSSIPPDCNGNGVPDEEDIANGTSDDCNTNGIPDSCDIDYAASGDCNGNGTPDECDIADGTSDDCNDNGVPDACDFVDGTSADCNSNGTPDECDIANDTSPDVNGNGTPDECECVGDVNGDTVVGIQDFLQMLSDWGACGGCPADLDGDGQVGVTDFLDLLASWGPCA